MAAALALVWLYLPKIAGIPGWLKHIGLLDWLKALAPLDQWFTAVGTVSAVFYAIFHETLLSWWRRPKLEVLFAEGPPYVIQIPVFRSVDETLAGSTGNASCQVRMLVKNEGTNRAEAVSVYARRLLRRNKGWLTPLEWFIPMDLKWAEDEATPTTAISAGVERTCNLIGIERPWHGLRPRLEVPQAPTGFNYASTCFAHVQTAADPTSCCNLVFPGDYRLELVLSAANTESRLLAFDFIFDGGWSVDQREMIPKRASFSLSILP